MVKDLSVELECVVNKGYMMLEDRCMSGSSIVTKDKIDVIQEEEHSPSATRMM